MEFVGPMFEVLKYIGGQIKSYTDHHRKLEGNMNNLKRKLDELNVRKQDLELRKEAEIRCGKRMKKEVENWFEDVQKKNTEVGKIQGKFGDVSYFSRAHLGKLVCQKIEEVERIYQQGYFPEGVAVDGPPVSGVTLPMPNLEGEIDVKERIWEYLMGDEVGMIGVCGMGGIGKTTIMKHINNQLLKESEQFEKVIWVTISKELNIFQLQEDIADSLKQSLPKGELERATALKDILEGKRYVLILDDVWKRFSLLDVGIPEPTLGQGKKMVLTSRSIEVCKSMSCKVVKVKPLSKEESMSLFLDHVGHNVLQNKNVGDIVSKIVEQCGGLPLAIVTIAGGMKGVEDLCEWRNALNELCERVKSVKGLDTEIFEHLKFSYDRLGDSKIQNCFLYCSLYPEDHKIQKARLIESWIDEGLLNDFGTREAMHDRGHSILNKLENNCLLERAGHYSGLGECVQMHDVLRDMALYIVCSQYMVKAGGELKEIPSEHEWTVDLEKVSLMKSQYSKILLQMSPRCPHLSTLLLQENWDLKGIPESFFKHMPGLKVLNLSGTLIKDLPNSISNLKNLNALILAHCEMLQYVPSLAELRALRKLDLFMTAIQKVPHGIELLEKPNILRVWSRFLKEVPVGILPTLSHLQCLILNKHLRGEEVGKLRKLEILECSFCDIQEFEEYAKSIQGKWPTYFYLQVGTSELSFSLYSVVSSLKQFWNGITFVNCEMEKMDHIELPNGLSVLCIEKSDDFNCLSNIPCFHKATELKSCNIWNCEGIDCVVDLSLSSLNGLPNLELLRLLNLGNLSELVKVGSVAVEWTSHAPTPLAIFSSLKLLYMDNCSKIKKLFPVELLQGLQNLEYIEVHSCWEMEEIIASEEEENHKGEGTTFILPKLKKLAMRDLPALKSICGGGSVIRSLQDLQIIDCPELKRIPLALPPLENGQPSPPPSLQLINVRPSEWWESLEWDHPQAKHVLSPFVSH
ncbi:LOW QUALITY PROTEIN: probable disease resistance protein At4g27220 [Durio zibethinus]|uniref:LOW QUALITY PROTEIN: probable disease resistance protein At4g27220 n=1 Tax=Durio zibethinus TaxID=66656 RepID=A0A6P5WLK5_DURZI|nr:LOW QUALITY PROTEIN: probable disease resistance protein At4g27220 [Durio zibethinus]